MFIITIKQL